MSLLEELYDTALRSDYPEQTPPGAKPPAALRRTLVIAVVALVGFILTTAAVTVLRDRPTTTAQREQLLDRIASAQQSNVDLDSEIAMRTADLDALAAAAIPDSAEGVSLRQRLDAALAGAGYTEVSGAGMTVTLADAENADAMHRVLDRDLQALVNGLWASGATAVSVNGIRLTSTTAIRSAGEAILVDYRPLAGPYTVMAVGADLETRLAGSSEGIALRALKDQFGIEVTIASGEVTVPASTAALHARKGPTS